MINGLRDDLLEGVSVLLARPGHAASPTPTGSGPAPAIGSAIGGLGAAVTAFTPELDETGEGGAEWVRARGRFDALLFDASQAALAGVEDLRTLTEDAWGAVSACATAGFIPDADGGRIVLLTPARESGPYASAAASALENLARTLSVEWARHAITTTAVVPSIATDSADLHAAVAFLLSRAGAYFSGTRLDLDLLAARTG